MDNAALIGAAYYAGCYVLGMGWGSLSGFMSMELRGLVFSPNSKASKGSVCGPLWLVGGVCASFAGHWLYAHWPDPGLRLGLGGFATFVVGIGFGRSLARVLVHTHGIHLPRGISDTASGSKQQPITSLDTFNRARQLHQPFFFDPIDYHVRNKRHTPQQIQTLRENADLKEAERLYKVALEDEKIKAGNAKGLAIATGGVDFSMRFVRATANAINAHLQLSLLYRSWGQFNAAIEEANTAIEILYELPIDLQNESETQGMRSEALFRKAEIDHVLGNKTDNELIETYEEIRELDKRSGDRNARKTTEALLQEVRSR